MNSGMVSMRYARALLDFAKNKKVEDKVFNEMKTLSGSFKSVRNLRLAMDNPVLETQDKLNLIVTAAGTSLSEEFVSFIKLVLAKRRESHLQRIALVYMDLYRKDKNINIGKLITAIPATDQVIDKMKTLLQSKSFGTLEFETETNPDIEGGFVLHIDTYRLDASVTSQIRQIKQQLIEQNRKVV